MSMQLSLDLFDRGEPTWDDVQKKRARVVNIGAYHSPCTDACLWHGNIFNGRCYLFQKPVKGGMCPASTGMEWV